MKTKYGRLIAIMILVLFAVTSFSARPAQASNFSIIPPASTPYGFSYGDWGAKWWQWLFSIPAKTNPVYTDDGFGNVDCGLSQSGQVWFLAGSATLSENGGNVTAYAKRTCNIPAGKAIFFPIFNTECSTLEGNGTTYQELLNCAIGLDNGASSLEADIDGVQVSGLTLNNSPYRAYSGQYYFTLPDQSLLQAWDVPGAVEGATSASVSDGWWLMLAPLSSGSHQIHFHGEAPLDGGGYFILDITYHLNIAAK